MLKIKKLENEIEKRILTGAVTSKRFLTELSTMVDFSYFNNTYIEKTIDWCLDFFYTYEDAPYKEIVNIIEEKTFNLKIEEIEIFSELIASVIDRLDAGEKVNEERLIDQTISYFKKRELEITTGNIRVLLDKGEVLEAERELLAFKNIAKNTSTWKNPFSNESLLTYFDQYSKEFFKMPGKLGELLGAWQKGWLVSFCGPFKRGKTWLLADIALAAMLSKKKTAFISLEMSEPAIFGRLYQRLVPGLEREVKGYLYPCFDCVKNQIGNCRKPERRNPVSLIKNKNLAKPEYKTAKESGYVPCTVCRGTEDFEITSWWEEVDIAAFDINRVGAELERFMKFSYDRFIKVKVYPRFSASCSDISRDLDVLELVEGFDPEVIIIDYAGIVRPEREIDGVEKEDSVWMSLARMAGERQALVVTADQVTREALDAINVKRSHTAKWIGKLAHVDAMYTINQTEEEKTQGIMRIGVMDHRHIEYYENRKATILQRLSTGQSHLDSEI